jgi:hypothetical protein
VETAAGPVRIYAEVVVEGTQVTIKNVAVYAVDSTVKLNVGVGQLLQAIKPFFNGLKEAGYTAVRILADRSLFLPSANPGRPVDIFRTLR